MSLEFGGNSEHGGEQGHSNPFYRPLEPTRDERTEEHSEFKLRERLHTLANDCWPYVEHIVKSTCALGGSWMIATLTKHIFPDVAAHLHVVETGVYLYIALLLSIDLVILAFGSSEIGRVLKRVRSKGKGK